MSEGTFGGAALELQVRSLPNLRLTLFCSQIGPALTLAQSVPSELTLGDLDFVTPPAQQSYLYGY